ncbi:MAG: hypothetical protein M0T84_04535 [Betaproteobacteria bacterium]|nr:hypothetical protein [Betaproteobacteria bacterium]
MRDESITLHLTAERVEAFCSRLAVQLRDHERRLAALHSLQTFIATAIDTPTQNAMGYKAIRDVVDRHAEQARAALLARKGADLKEALDSRDAEALARVYRTLSRNGFWNTLAITIDGMHPADSSALADWAAQWLKDARNRGEAASGFPDAIDFNRAGIDVAEYAAIDDLNRYLTGALRR